MTHDGESRGVAPPTRRDFLKRAGMHDGDFVVSVGEAMRAVVVNDAILRSVESGRPEEVEPVAG